MRYLVKGRVKSGRAGALAKAIADRTLGRGSIADDEYLYDMQMARIDAKGEAHWVETCFCDPPLEEERPYWEKYFDLLSVKDAHSTRNCRHENGTERWHRSIVVLDGVMGTTLQRLGLTEADYRGERFRDWKGKDLKGAIELLLLTKPEAVERVHEEYLRAGADVIETNTFSATTIGLHEFLFAGKTNNGRKDPEFFERVVNDVGLRDTIREINSVAAGMAREAADRVGNETGEQRFVAGARGPLPVTASLSSDVNDPGFRAVTFDQIKQSYRDQIDALLAGGVDLLMVETIFDTLNAKAALFAILEASEKNPIPLIVSGTITDRSGRTLSGQTLEAFLTSIAHANPLMVGLK